MFRILDKRNPNILIAEVPGIDPLEAMKHRTTIAREDRINNGHYMIEQLQEDGTWSTQLHFLTVEDHKRLIREKKKNQISS